ncbi:MAG TPA: hypothetical protein VMZ30_17690 [Pyrinomonadaceae bacterium]|nr:hypothetical protein [Pyrinomonadaceae bacterium]
MVQSRSTRFNIESDVALWLMEDRSTPRTGRVRNISGTGFCAAMDLPAPVGSMVGFEVRLPVGSSIVRGLGKLIWQHASNMTNGIAIRHYTIEQAAA